MSETLVALSLAERIAGSVVFDMETGCAVWCGGINSEGYGQILLSGKSRQRVHRVVWQLTNGAIPNGMQIDHICRNRRCCRIEHLRLVTPRVNSLENSLSIAAKNAQKTRCPRCESDFSIDGNGYRFCAECRAVRRRTQYAADVAFRARAAERNRQRLPKKLERARLRYANDAAYRASELERNKLARSTKRLQAAADALGKRDEGEECGP